MEHWFWLGLIGIALVWYVVVTILVAYRGAKDIRQMIKDLARENDVQPRIEK